jgi:hypothetical protein
MTRRVLKPFLPVLVGLLALALGLLAAGSSAANETPSHVPAAQVTSIAATVQPGNDETPPGQSGGNHGTATQPVTDPSEGSKECASCVQPPVD